MTINKIEIKKTDKMTNDKYDRDVFVDGIFRGAFTATWGVNWSFKDLGDELVVSDGTSEGRMFEDRFVGHTFQARSIADMDFIVRAALHLNRLPDATGVADRADCRAAWDAYQDAENAEYRRVALIEENAVELLAALQAAASMIDGYAEGSAPVVKQVEAVIAKATGEVKVEDDDDQAVWWDADTFETCKHGHLECSDKAGGRCSDEEAGAINRLRDAQRPDDKLLDELTSWGSVEEMVRNLRQANNHYRPTCRIDLDPRYAQVADIFDREMEAINDSRRAWRVS